jgi:glutamate--cysteine ligase
MRTTEQELASLAERASRFSIALVPGGNYPFNNIDNVNWTPNRRIEIMLDYFSSVGESGVHGPHVMGLALSTQATFDYVSASDLCRKLRMQVAVSPIAAALFVNSPLEDGRPTGIQSRRMAYWFRHSPRRTGLLPPALRDQPTIDEFVEWAAGLPMIYRKQGNGYVAAPDKPFGELLRDGFADGTRPNWSDWVLHLSQIWTDVRLRGTLELRAFDGPPEKFVASVPAFWSGLSYHAPSCDAAWELTGHRTVAEYNAIMHGVARRGIHARVASMPVIDVARELVRLAKEGLRARVHDGLEHPEALAYLEPLEEVLDAKETWADTCLRRWEGEFRGRPDLYVQAYRTYGN